MAIKLSQPEITDALIKYINEKTDWKFSLSEENAWFNVVDENGVGVILEYLDFEIGEQ